MRLLFPALLLALPAAAQPICLADDARLPFIDAEVLACDPPRLVLVREEAAYDAELGEWQQAILLRFANPGEEELIVSGVVELAGAELIGEPSYRAADLRRGDFEWAVAPLSHYEDPGDCSALLDPPLPHPTRGLEFGDLMRFGPDGVRFEFAAAADLDDVRFIVASPDPASAGSVRVELFDILTSPDVPIQVGAADANWTPDDGLYDGLRVTARLREVDLAIPQDCVAGTSDGGLIFDLEVPVDAPADRSRRADRNGDLGPVEALGAPSALRWRPSDLLSADGDVLQVVELDGLDPALCAAGDVSLPLTALIEPADLVPDGVYGGTIEVWEDTDGDRRFDANEAGDTVRLAVVVGPDPGEDPCELLPIEPDAGFDPGPLDADRPPPDAALDASPDADLDAGIDPPDGDLPDAGLDAAIDLDAGGDAAADGGPDGEVDGDGPILPLLDGAVDRGALADAGQADGAPDGAPALDGAAADVELMDGAIDGGVADGGPGDGDPGDDGPGDEGPGDGGPSDGGPGDGGAGDGGVGDGAPQDGAPGDATSLDADAATDADLPDTYPPADGGVDGAPTDTADLDPSDGAPTDAGVSDVAPTPADPGDPQGGSLSCQTTPGRGGSPALLLVLFALLAFRRRLLLPALLIAFAAPADAQVDVRRFTPTPAFSPYLNLDGAETLGPGRVGARVISVIEQRPLVFARDGERTVDIISIRLGLDTAVAVGVTDWLDVGANLPLVLLQDGRTIAGGTLDGFALADPSLAAKVRFLSPTEGVGLALRLGGSAPMGDPDALAGEPGPTGTAMLALELPVSSRFDIALDVGYRLREATRLGDVEVGDELLFGLGASWRVTPAFALAAEFTGATGAADPFGVDQQTPGELDALARVEVVDELAAVVGVGAGLLPGYGSPMYRAFVGLQYAPRNHDFDGDGLADGRDRCVETAGVPVEQGCPAPARVAAAVEEKPVSRDQDGDGLLDALDQCPFLPEDRDGFRDDDGCPDADNDLDLLADGFDADPLGPEDWDAFEDRDGIPDPDNDRDGLADFRDPCPDEKGGEDGCPTSLAPSTPDAARGLAGGEGPQAPLVLGRTLHPAEPIIFEFARPGLTPEAGPLVDGLARYLIEHPELDRVEVGVHVDAMGSRRWKHWLSRARAASVVAALVDRGVPPERVFPRGYGPEVPVDSNRTKAGRFKNRRVELRALLPFEVARPTRAVQPDRSPRLPRKRSTLPEPRARWLAPDALVLRPTAPIIFTRRRASLTPGAAPRVAELAARLKANPSWRRVEVGVHTDGLGDRDWKLRLSRDRAAAVVDALVAEGVERSRLTPRGYGATRRLRGDDTLEDRATNRRVELRVLDTSVSLAPGDGR